MRASQKPVSLSVVIGFVAMLNVGPTLAQDPPWTCEDPGNLPQQGMNYCAYQDLLKADEELNALWPQVRSHFKKVDRQTAEWREDLVGADEAILKSQRAWIKYRDGTCKAMGFEARGGTLEPLIVNSCLANLTSKRIDELKSMLVEY